MTYKSIFKDSNLGFEKQTIHMKETKMMMIFYSLQHL